MEKVEYIRNNLTLKEYINRTLLTTSVGLLITSLVAFFSSKYINLLFYNHPSLALPITIISLIGEVAIVVSLSKRVMKLSKVTAISFFVIYSVLNGYNLSYLFSNYSDQSIAFAFGVTAVLFLCMSIIGHTTSIDLLKYSHLFRIGLIAIIITSIISIFFYNELLSWIVSCVSIILFLALIAYDTQKLRNTYNECYSNPELLKKVSIIGALELYLDFINILIRILGIFGKRRN